MVTRKIIDATFQRQSLNPKLEMEASSCFEVKRYVAHGRGIGIIHQICLEPGDIDQFRSLSLTRQIPHPTAKLIFRRSKTFTAVEKKLVEMLLAMRPSTRKEGTLEYSFELVRDRNLHALELKKELICPIPCALR